MNTMKEKLNKVAVAGLAAGIPTALYAFPVYASDTSTDVTAPSLRRVSQWLILLQRQSVALSLLLSHW